MQKTKQQQALYSLFYQLAKHGHTSTTNHIKNSPCWEHNKETYKQVDCKEYPQYFKSNVTLLHRLMYAVYYETPLEKTDVIMHLCHNRRCFHPLHLKLGTHKENNKATLKRSGKYKKKDK